LRTVIIKNEKILGVSFFYHAFPRWSFCKKEKKRSPIDVVFEYNTLQGGLFEWCSDKCYLSNLEEEK